jgi:predicted nucleotidyltransferase
MGATREHGGSRAPCRSLAPRGERASYSHRVLSLLPSERGALDEFCGHVRSVFGARLRELALFGSRARGEGHEDSDLDVLVVVRDLTGAEARDVGRAAGDALTDHDVILAPFVVSTEHMDRLRSRERTIALEIARDAVPL